MDSFLTRQLDDRLCQASRISSAAGRPVTGNPGRQAGPAGSPRPRHRHLERPHQRRRRQQRGFLANDATRASLSSADDQILLDLRPNTAPVDRTLSTGDYRLVAVATGYGDIIVTGLPLAAKQSTLTSLVWTMVVVSSGGLLLIGLVGTALIRRTMKPLEQLSEVATKVSQLPLDAGEVALAVRVPPAPPIPAPKWAAWGTPST